VENLSLIDASFQAYLRQGRLMGTRCPECGELSLPPRPICPHCFSAAPEWAEMPTRGRLAAFTAIYVPPSGPAAQGFDRQHPYLVGVVDLENGLRITARILGPDPTHPEAIPLGLPLTLHPGDIVTFHV
jgi:uncharacterized protein